jgi:hypothetical protein
MWTVRTACALGLVAALAGAEAVAETRLVVSNRSGHARTEALVEAPIPDPDVKAWRVSANGVNRPAQLRDTDGDGRADVVAFLADLPADGRVTVVLEPGEAAAPRRVDADLGVRVGATMTAGRYEGGRYENRAAFTVPADHAIGNGLIAYEGPGWESDRVAYRLYLDNRNVTDVFGKRRPEPVLRQIGRGDDYHALTDWGMDVLKVGPSLGAGGLGVLRNGKADWLGPSRSLTARVDETGPLVASLSIETLGWRLGEAHHDTLARYAITAGSRLTRVSVRASAGAPLTAGIVKHDGVEVLRREAGGWGYVATLGDQSLAKDALGLVVFYRLDQRLGLGDDGATLFVRFRDGPVDYAFAGVWAQEPGAPTSPTAFRAWLDETLADLDRPVEVSLAR